MNFLKKITIFFVLCGIGAGLGYGIAEYLRESDYDKAISDIKAVTGIEGHIYAIKRVRAEGSCSGKTFTFYSKGFEIAEMQRWGGSEFTIAMSYPTTIEFYHSCQNTSYKSDELCTSILGAYMTIKIKSTFASITGKEYYLPVKGERSDDAFEKIIALKGYNSNYYSVGLLPTYTESKPEMHQYEGGLGIATVELLYNKYGLYQNKDEIFTLYTTSIIGGSIFGLLLAFTILRIRQIRLKRTSSVL